MITTHKFENSIPDFISDQRLFKLVLLAYRHLQLREQQQLLYLAGLPNLDLNTRTLCRLIRLTYIGSSFDHKLMFTTLLERGIDAYILKTSNFLSYEHHQKSA
jgi:hypothetical protein